MRQIRNTITVMIALVGTTMMYTNCSGTFSASDPAAALSSAASIPTATVTPGPTDSPAAPVASSGDFPAPFTPVKTVTVCASGCDYTLPSQAIAAAVDQELIQIKAGDYVDCASISTANIWIQGVGGFAHMHDQTCASKGILVFSSQNATVDNIELSGAAISADDGNNGAGIRGEGLNLTVRNCYFHDNQDGILTDASSGAVTILNSHFARHGVDGYEHDIYIGHNVSLLLQNSVLEQVYMGNVVKSRAWKSTIQCNQIQNGYDSTYTKNGYLIDLPNGGEEHILNNVISQGTYNGGQSTFVEFGAEGLVNPSATLEMTGNYLINDLGSGTFMNFFAAPTSTATLTNNLLIGGGTALGGIAGSAVESGDQAFLTRSAAGLNSQFPFPSGCPSVIGNLPIQ